MGRIFITGSSDGLGLLSAKQLMAQGHQVVLHARDTKRKDETLKKMSDVVTVLTGDLGNLEETKRLAENVNELGSFDVVIHNAGVYRASPQELFAVNVLAPYVLTCMIPKPSRLIYLCSDMHLQGKVRFENFNKNVNKITYSDTKLYLLMLCKAIAKKLPEVFANAVDPGWVPTKMGGSGAPDDLRLGYETQTWLAVSDDKDAMVSGQYFHHRKKAAYNTIADDSLRQKELLDLCQDIAGVPMQ